MADKINVFIACREPVYCEGLISILAHADSRIAILDFKILGMVNAPEKLIEATSELPVDVLVTDFCITGNEAIDPIRHLQESNGKMTILFLIDKIVPYPVRSFLQAGSAICIPKISSCKRIISAIIALSFGEAVIDLESMKNLLSSQTHPYQSNTGYITPSGLKVTELKPTQLQVLELMAGGLSNKQIAKQLAISERTVESRLTRIFQFAGVNTRIEAIVWAMREGYLLGTTKPVQDNLPP